MKNEFKYKTKATKPLSVRLSAPIIEDLKKLAKQMGVTQTEIIKTSIIHTLKQLKK